MSKKREDKKTYLGYELEGRLRLIKEKWSELEPRIPKEIRDIPLRKLTYENDDSTGIINKWMKIGIGQGVAAYLIKFALFIDATIRSKKLIVDKNITIPTFVKMLGERECEDVASEFFRNSID